MITIIKVRLLGTRRQSGTVPGTVPDLSGDGDAPPSPSPICPESGTLPRPRPRFAGDGDAPPSPIPIGGSAPCNTAFQTTNYAMTPVTRKARPKTGRCNFGRMRVQPLPPEPSVP